MKVNNLLKKVGSVITTAALLATLGTTAFADGDEGTASGSGEFSIMIGTVAGNDTITINDVKAKSIGDGKYTIKVEYETRVANEIGMTMLTYKKGDNKSFDNANTPYDDGTEAGGAKKMQIVGIEQNAKKEGKADAPASDTFTFTATTNSTNNGKYYIPKGEKFIVAVSGDKCTPAYALCGVNAVAVSIFARELENVPVAANASDTDIQSALDTAAAEKATVSVIDDVGGEHQVSLSDASIKDDSWTPGEDGKYTKSYTFQKGNTSIKGVEFNENKTVTVTATITKTEVYADTVSSVDGLTAKEGSVNTFEKTYSAEQNTEEPVIKDALFKDKTAKIANGIATGTVTLDPTWAVSKEKSYDKETDKDQNLVYEVTIPSTATVTGNDYLKIAADGLKFTVNVTVSRTQYINAITLVDAPESIEVSSTATDDQIKEALNKAIENAKIKIDEKEPVDKSKITEKDWVITRTEKVPTSAKLHVSAVDSSLGNLPASGIDVTPAITINVKTAPKGKLGDVNGDDKVNDKDVFVLARYVDGWAGYDTKVDLELSDVDANGKVNDKDVFVLARHVDGWTGYENLPYKK